MKITNRLPYSTKKFIGRSLATILGGSNSPKAIIRPETRERLNNDLRSEVEKLSKLFKSRLIPLV